MHWARFAPELSATVTIVRSWIMAMAPGLPGALDELHEAPALVLGHGPGLHEADHVTDLALVLLVVDLELLPPPHVAAHRRVLDESLDGHDHRLVHAIAHHLAGADLPAAAYRRHSVHGSRRPQRPTRSFSFSTVSRRAISRRLSRILSGLSSCFIVFRNRRLNSSSRSSATRVRISSGPISRTAVGFTRLPMFTPLPTAGARRSAS